MEPKLPAPNTNPEYGPAGQGYVPESLPLPPSPETGIDLGERPMEQRAEAAPVSINAAPALPTPVTLPQVPVPIATDDATGQQVVAGSPSVAGDDDLIEKEWVDKAKKIIAETRDDPHRREREVGRLQVDYLRKRYGKELGSSDGLGE